MADVSIHSGVRSPLSVWRQWRRKAAQPRNVQTTAPDQLIVIEGVRYVVGLEWRLLPPTR